MKHQSGYSKQFKLVNNWTRIVKEHIEINKYDLMDELKISVPQYNQMKGFVENRASEVIEYDKPTKIWRYKGNSEE